MLKTLKNSAHGRALTELCEHHLEELDDVSTIKTFEEVLGRQYAKTLIKDIFYYLDLEKKVERKKNQYN